ncbi:DUF4328 domain-containing protein [Psychromonas aquimarina]|uniref:DUF4328 domain-containing protein n=1 Tax=Psychromonas aquimarina TaxID=444919 RepID=UPI00040CD07F|nr:DUF4328 domain-containing protein [Psychromonas aquimarina]
MLSVKNEFKHSQKLTIWIRYVLYAQIVTAVLAIIFGTVEYQLLSAFQDGLYTSLEQAFAAGETAINILQGVGILSLIVFIGSALLIVQWIYRANYNVRQLGAENMTYTPAWSIAYFFIPVFNLWKPYQAMKELWQASANPQDCSSNKVSIVVPIWWALWLTSNMLGQSIFRLSAETQTLPELLNLNMLSQVSNVLDIPLAIVTLLLLNSIESMQNRCK